MVFNSPDLAWFIPYAPNMSQMIVKRTSSFSWKFVFCPSLWYIDNINSEETREIKVPVSFPTNFFISKLKVFRSVGRALASVDAPKHIIDTLERRLFYSASLSISPNYEVPIMELLGCQLKLFEFETQGLSCFVHSNWVGTENHKKNI